MTWEKDGVVLSDQDERLQFFSAENAHTIRIDSVNYTDAGVYRISVKNPLGRQHAQVENLLD